jgi:hypothetical protein
MCIAIVVCIEPCPCIGVTVLVLPCVSCILPSALAMARNYSVGPHMFSRTYCVVRGLIWHHAEKCASAPQAELGQGTPCSQSRHYLIESPEQLLIPRPFDGCIVTFTFEEEALHIAEFARFFCC